MKLNKKKLSLDQNPQSLVVMIDSHNTKAFFKDAHGEILISIYQIETHVCYSNHGHILVKISYDKEAYGPIGRKLNRTCSNLHCIRVLQNDNIYVALYISVLFVNFCFAYFKLCHYGFDIK